MIGKAATCSAKRGPFHVFSAIGMASMAVAVGLLACTGNAAQSALEEAEAALAGGDYGKAVASASRGLAAQPQKATLRWRLELAKLEGQARGGKASEAAATLKRLAALPSSKIQPSHYLSSADQLKAAGQGKGSIEMLHDGLQRFPENVDLKKAIEQAKSKGGGDELQALRSLGYLD